MKNIITAPKGASPNAQASRKLTTTGMKLRFKVNQAECFRRGINCDKSIVTVEVDPSTLSQPERNLIADRLDGIDVLELFKAEDGIHKSYTTVQVVEKFTNHLVDESKPNLIEANEPNFEALMEAIRANQNEVESPRRPYPIGKIE